MKKSAFHEARPKTPKGEARQREVKVMKAMEDLLDLDNEEQFKKDIHEKYGIGPRSPRYAQIMAIWREQRRGKS